MGDLRDDDIIDPNALRPRELIVRIYEKVERLEKQSDDRSKQDLETQLKLRTLEIEVKHQVDKQSRKQGAIWGLISGAVSAVIAAIATKIFG